VDAAEQAPEFFDACGKEPSSDLDYHSKGPQGVIEKEKRLRQPEEFAIRQGGNKEANAQVTELSSWRVEQPEQENV